ncbi:hypothetical protein CRUP_021996 [Coryphaenoides rupestris]|nr:hypothetical protein CRUP_021996 [Coryphaenoides rupestris]
MNKLRGNHPCVLLAEQGRGKNFVIYKPNIGKQSQSESLENLQLRYRKVTPEEAQDSWENQFTFSFKKCSHANWNGKCKKIEEGQECLQGMRLRQYHMLCGALLRVWKRVADVVADVTSTSILQIIPENCVARVRDELIQMDEEVKKRRKEKDQQALEQRQADERQRRLVQANQHLMDRISQNHIMNQSLAQGQGHAQGPAQGLVLAHKPQNHIHNHNQNQNQNPPTQRTQPRGISQVTLQRGKLAQGQASSQRAGQNLARLPPHRTPSQIQPRTQNNRPNNSNKGGLGLLPSMATLSSHFPPFSSQPFMNSFPSLKSHTLSSQGLLSNPSSSASKNPLDDILDLTMSPSLSPDSTEGGPLGLEGLAGVAPGNFRDDFALESLISPNVLGLHHQRSAQTLQKQQQPRLQQQQPSPLLRQLQQQQQQQQQQQDSQSDYLDFLDFSMAGPHHPSSSSTSSSAAGGPVPHGGVSHVARGRGMLSAAGLLPPSSASSPSASASSSPLFSTNASPASLFSSSNASPSSLFSSPVCLLPPPPPDPSLPSLNSLPNGHCGSTSTLDVREVLNSMLLASNDRKSVIQFRLPE